MNKVKFYEGKHIVRHERVEGETVDNYETYVCFEDGKIYLREYKNFGLKYEKLIADVENREIS